MNKEYFLQQCRILLSAYEKGLLGYMKMPEDENPGFSDDEYERRLVYFTLPMALNYQRNSYALRESVHKTYRDDETSNVFSVQNSAEINESELRAKLMKYKVALQPNKHVHTWKTIAVTISQKRGSVTKLLEACNYDFLQLKNIVQREMKKGFPYLSGPKIFNYRAFIIQEYGTVRLKNGEYIEIAPDTHITQCSVKLGLVTQAEAETLSKEALSKKRRDILEGTGIQPIQMHPPLRFWSKNNFVFSLDVHDMTTSG